VHQTRQASHRPVEAPMSAQACAPPRTLITPPGLTPRRS
jgi:hypothetical protein